MQATLRLQGPGVDDLDVMLQSDLITALAESMTTVGKAAIRIVLVSDAYSFRRRRKLLAASHGASPARALLQLPLATDVTPAGHSGPLPGVKDVTVEINAGSGSRVPLVEADLRQVVTDNTVAVRVMRHRPRNAHACKHPALLTLQHLRATLHC